MESNNENKNSNNNNISIETIKNMIDPISRIIAFKKYIFLNNSTIDINFINNNINILKEWLNDYKKYLFDYDNKNISKQIIINRYIIYIILSLLFEPEINPLMDEFDYEFLYNINNFCFFYLKMSNDNQNIKENIILYLYILFLLNNLICVHPDEELIKATIVIKNILQLFYFKFFSFVYNNNNNNNNNNNINKKIVNNNENINECNKYELLEFSFLKLIENCCLYLHLNDNDIKELLNILLSFLYYNYYNNNIKLLI